MTTLSQEIASTRYDLVDEVSTQYPDALLVDYYNRAIRGLVSFLATIGSDRVFSDFSFTAPAGSSQVLLPGDFSSPVSVSVNNTTLSPKPLNNIVFLQKESGPGTPSFYAVLNDNIVFDRALGSGAEIYIQYAIKAPTIGLDDNMPFGDAHNDSLRGAVVMMAKTRNNKDMIGNLALHDFFREAEVTTIVRRTRRGRPIKLGF